MKIKVYKLFSWTPTDNVSQCLSHALLETPQSVGLDCLLSGHGYCLRYFNDYIVSVNPDSHIQTYCESITNNIGSQNFHNNVHIYVNRKDYSQSGIS